MSTLPTTIVIPTIGRQSLHDLLDALAFGHGPRPAAVVIVDDSSAGIPTDDLDRPGLATTVEVVRSGGGGPARARNIGWRRACTPWVSFLDDDVVPRRDWLRRLDDDLQACGPTTVGCQGMIRVPLPTHRAPTDWERSTAGLETAPWITADMTYRRSILQRVGGFDERFRRAYREDADLALRVLEVGGDLMRGRRYVNHPARPAPWWISVRQQAGNADDMLMDRLHGRQWRQRVGAGRGRRRRHLGITAAGIAAAALAMGGRQRLAAAAGSGWLAGTLELTAARVRPGPRSPREVARMAATSLAIPVAAAWHTTYGRWRHRRARPWQGIPELVLFDRDGTLIHDVPYNGDPDRVRPASTAVQALERLRAAHIRTGVVTNQSGVGRGLISIDQMKAVNARVDEMLGPFDVWKVCPHVEADRCTCHKPAPGLIVDACAELDVPPTRCVVVGDLGSDVRAAEAADAAGILVPTPVTRRDEVTDARSRASDLADAADQILRGAW